jgi:putative protease
MKIPELLAPAGSPEKLRVALAYGADAVYFAGRNYGLRAFADNFSDEEIAAAIAETHRAGRRAYVTVNIFPHNDDLGALPAYLAFLRDCGADAAIVSDPGVFRLARKTAPELPIHISTQANTVNWAAALFWEELGVRRVVLAREVSLADIRIIRAKTGLELEAFVHGAMCVSYSGRCLLSNYLTGRDANRGECAQACRWRWHVVEETRPGQYFPVSEDRRGTYVFNSKDLCLLPHIPDLVGSGLDSLKIEGRMKSVHYVATVVKVYREALDAYAANPEDFAVRKEWLAEFEKISHRPYTAGFAFARPAATTSYTTGDVYAELRFRRPGARVRRGERPGNGGAAQQHEGWRGDRGPPTAGRQLPSGYRRHVRRRRRADSVRPPSPAAGVYTDGAAGGADGHAAPPGDRRCLTRRRFLFASPPATSITSTG